MCSLSQVADFDRPICRRIGASRANRLLAHARFLDRIAQIHATTTRTVGICDGVAPLVAAGILDDVSVTTNDA